MSRFWLCLLLVIGHAQVQADSRDDFPSCYSVFGEQASEQTATPRELVVIIDQTVKLNIALKRHVHASIHSFLQPGDRFTLLTFSAYSQSHYASMPLRGTTDIPLDEATRYHTSLADLRKFDRCMSRQRASVAHTIDNAVKTALNGADDSLPRTEVAASLADFAESVIAVSRAQRRVVLLVSDMLENSATATFYKGGQLAQLNVEQALKATEAAGGMSNWQNAEVYIIGAAFSPEGIYRTRPVLESLRLFWTAYFEKSGARLMGWGQPELLVQIP